MKEQSVFSSLIYIMLVVVASYGLLLLLVFFSQDSLLYIPNGRSIQMTPADAGMTYEQVELKTSDHVSIHGWFIPAKPSRGVILFCHGNAGNISHRLDTLILFKKLGFSTFIFDYRGYGQSGGKPSEEGTYRDVMAAYLYLIKERAVNPDRIVLFGRSIGAAIAAYLATQNKCAALIVESGFTSVPELAQQLYPFLPAKLISKFSYDTKAFLKKTTCPVLVAHSGDDEIIPFSHGRQLFESAGKPKHFLEMRGGHNDGFYVTGNDYFKGFDQFLTEALHKE